MFDPQPIAVLRTGDGGATWQRAALGDLSSTGLTSLAFADGEHGWAVGDRVLASDDGGATWHDSGVDVPDGLSMRPVPMLNGVACGGGAVWAVGRRDIILSTVDIATDTAPPLTIDDGDRQWHRDDVTLHLAPFDAGSGVAQTEYRIDGSPTWTTGGEVLFGAPLDHLGDGRHTVTYRSRDVDGNVEASRQCPVLVDTTPPETKALCAAGAYRGRTAVVSARASDALSPYADITLELGHRVGGENRVVKSVKLGSIKIGKWAQVRVRYNVPRGTYWWHAAGTDLAGNAVEWASDAPVKVK